MKTNIKIVILLLAGVIGAAGIYLYLTGNGSSGKNNKSQREQASSFFPDYEQYSYQLKFKTDQSGTIQNGDYSLVAINNSNGSEKILVESILDKLPELREGGRNLTLAEFSVPARTTKLYFISVIPESDAPPQGLYKFSMANGEFIRMTELEPYIIASGTYIVSEDKTKVVSAIDPQNDKYQKLTLIDLLEESAGTLVELSANETLDYCVTGCLGDSSANIKWVDNDTVEYFVYDLNQVESVGEGIQEYAFVAKRTVDTD